MIPKYNKKAQVTIFVILGIIIIISIILFLRLRNNTQEPTEDNLIDQLRTGPIISNIEQYTEYCTNNILNESLKQTLRQGGIYDIDQTNHKIIGQHKVPYYLHNQQINIPTEEEFYESLKKMIIQKFDECADNYAIFQDLDVIIEKQETNINLNTEEGIIIYLNPSLIITHENSETTSREQRTYIPFNIRPILNTANQIINNYLTTQQYLDIQTINQIAQNQETNFNFININENELLLIIHTQNQIEYPLFSTITII